MKKIIYLAIAALSLAGCKSGEKDTKDSIVVDTTVISESMEGRVSDTDTVLNGKTEKELAAATIDVVENDKKENKEEKKTDDGVVKALPSNGKGSFLDFTASWCGPCKMMKPVVNELEDTYDDYINFVIIDIDANPELAQKYGIRAVPTFIFLDSKGNVVKRVEGVVDQAVLENQISMMISK